MGINKICFICGWGRCLNYQIKCVFVNKSESCTAVLWYTINFSEYMICYYLLWWICHYKFIAKNFQMVFFPEACDYICANKKDIITQAEPIIGGNTVNKYKELAMQHNIWLSMGGVHEMVSIYMKTTNHKLRHMLREGVAFCHEGVERVIRHDISLGISFKKIFLF